MEYKKEKLLLKKNKRLQSSGSRGMQRKLLHKGPLLKVVDIKPINVNDTFTGEEVDKQIIEAVKEVNFIVKGLELEKENLDRRMVDLESIIKDKDTIIDNLNEINNKLTATVNHTEPVIVNNSNKNNDRPIMEPVFIDPIDMTNEKSVESHITVDTISEEKENINDKVNKLKSMVGSLKK